MLSRPWAMGFRVGINVHNSSGITQHHVVGSKARVTGSPMTVAITTTAVWRGHIHLRSCSLTGGSLGEVDHDSHMYSAAAGSMDGSRICSWLVFLICSS